MNAIKLPRLTVRGVLFTHVCLEVLTKVHYFVNDPGTRKHI